MAKFKQIPEFLLAKLWQERASRQRSLRTGDGRRFRVIYPGRVGNTAGPDFRDAVLLEEGSGLVRGDVEIHVNQRDWLAHGHGDDPRYNGVVLHAVGGMDATTTTLHRGQQVPVLSLDSLVDRAPSKAGQAGLWPLLKPHGYLPPRSAPELGDLLDDAGDKRFLGKSGTFRVFIDEESPEQVLYSALMEALGYSQNREPFLELATRVPYSLLKKAVLKLPVQERVGVIQAMLLTASGFLPARRGRPGYRVAKPRRSTKPEARPVQSHGEKVRQRLSAPGGAMTLERWHLFRIRPQNHPVQRIIGFARLLDLFLPSAVAQPSDLPPAARKGIVEGAIGLVSAPLGSAARSQNCWSPLERGLMSTWSPLSGGAGDNGAGRSCALIGRGRARDMAVNCVLPFLHAFAQLRGDTNLGRLALKVYREFPKLQENELTREMRRELIDSISPGSPGDGPSSGSRWDKVVDNARRQQGLLQLHHLSASP